MKTPPTPSFEDERLQALEDTNLLYSPAEERFDRITRLASRHFDVPISLISIVAADRQWFKSSQGLVSSETSREVSFCGHAILNNEPLVISDTLTDPDFTDNPLVTANPKIRFYAGHPLFYKGMPIGTLCLIDRRPRDFYEQDRDSLKTLAAFAEAEIASNAVSESEQFLIGDSDQDTRKLLLDPVTQTWNETGLNILISREINLAMVNKDEYALLSLQVIIPESDFNSMSEEDGAVLLRKVSQDVRSALRPYDFFARTGVSTLVIFSPKCQAEMSELLFDRIRSRIEETPCIVNGQSIQLVIRGGIAFTTEGTTSKSLLDSANQALSDAVADRKPFVRYLV